MPLALYSIKDSALSSIFVIFICAVWPLLINTAFGVTGVRREWLNVARTLEVGLWRRSVAVILPAAAPTILTGMRISVGIAWLVIVAAEMLVGCTGIGYFVWNEWNNLSLSNVIHRDTPDRRGRHGVGPGAGLGWPLGELHRMKRLISVEGLAKSFAPQRGAAGPCAVFENAGSRLTRESSSA